MAVFILVAVPEAGSCISPAATCSFKKARQTPPTTLIPEKPSDRQKASTKIREGSVG